MGLKAGALRGSLRNISTGVGAIPDSGVSRWKFEQDVTDSWGTNDGTDNTSAGYLTDSAVDTYAKDFDGTDDYVAVGIANLSAYSVSYWVNPDGNIDSAESHVAFRDNNGIYFRQNSTDTLQFFHRDGGDSNVTLSTSLAASTWTHIVGTWDGSNLTLYKDGSSADSGTASGMTQQGLVDRFGAREDGSPLYYDGGLDDIRLYDKELSSTEVSNLYNTGSISG